VQDSRTNSSGHGSRKRFLVIAVLGLMAATLLILVLFGSRVQGISTRVVLNMNADLDLTPVEVSSLTHKAAKGDSAAAWKLYLCYDMARSDEKAADAWLCRAAELQNTEAQRVLASAIRERNHSPGDFGATGPEAFHNLLEHGSHTNGQACYELASAYAEGYPSPPDFIEARFYYTRGSELGDRMCWEKLSQYCQKGMGGDRDEASAYYWISLETRCVHPQSISGKESWALREEIAKQLPIEELKHQWERIDQYISQVRAGKISVDPAPFGKGEYYPDESVEGTKLSNEAEADHRQRMERRGK
jgi:hypothetical protein